MSQTSISLRIIRKNCQKKKLIDVHLISTQSYKIRGGLESGQVQVLNFRVTFILLDLKALERVEMTLQNVWVFVCARKFQLTLCKKCSVIDKLMLFPRNERTFTHLKAPEKQINHNWFVVVYTPLNVWWMLGAVGCGKNLLHKWISSMRLAATKLILHDATQKPPWFVDSFLETFDPTSILWLQLNDFVSWTSVTNSLLHLLTFAEQMSLQVARLVHYGLGGWACGFCVSGPRHWN